MQLEVSSKDLLSQVAANLDLVHFCGFCHLGQKVDQTRAGEHLGNICTSFTSFARRKAAEWALPSQLFSYAFVTEP